MKAIRVDRTGGPEVLQLVDVPEPVPGPGEALVRQSAIGINYIDVYVRTGLYKKPPPFTNGREGAGVVEAVGEGVTEVKPGDRVAYAATPNLGGYAEKNVVPARELVPIPDGVDDADACAVMLQGMTAHYLAHDTFPLHAGHVALVHAAAGGVGSLLVQLAKARGATVVATVGTEDKAALARGYGADHVIVYAEEDFADATRALIGEHAVDVAYDSVGKETWERSLGLLRPRGMLVSFGNASGAVTEFSPLTLSQKGSLFLTRPTLFNYTATVEELDWRANDVLNWIAQGKLKLHIHKVYPLSDTAQAHNDLESRNTTGKLLLRVG